jgi:hypothetical protein
MSVNVPSTQRKRLSALPASARSASLSKALIGWTIMMLGVVGLDPAPLAAESMIVLESPGELEGIGATTFDQNGNVVGESSFDIVTEETGVRHLTVKMEIEGGGSNVSEAMLAPILGATSGSHAGSQIAQPLGQRRSFRLLEERSQATRADGVSLELLVIDHTKGRVSCYPPDGNLTNGRHIDLPRDDRVVNVPMQLLFQPLVSRQVAKLRFQIAVCRDGPLLHKMIAERGTMSRRDGRDVIEIRYGPEVSRAIAWFASRLLPSFSFWFDADNGGYIGHRMPLHRKGPEILLVRQGLSPFDVGLD